MYSYRNLMKALVALPILAIIAVGGMLVYFQIAPHRPRLLAKSRLIYRTPAGMVLSSEYKWVNETTVMQDTGIVPPVRRIAYSTIDISTGRVRKLVGLLPPKGPPLIMSTYEISPDGKRILISNRWKQGNSFQNELYLSDIAGDRNEAIFKSAAFEYLPRICWQNDSSSWYEIGSFTPVDPKYFAEKHDLVGKKIWLNSIEVAPKEMYSFQTWGFMSPVYGRKLISTTSRADSHGKYVFHGIREIDVTNANAPREYPFPMGQSTDYFRSVRISSDGKRYAVIVFRPSQAPQKSFLGKAVQWMTGASMDTVSIYVANLDGTDVHEVAFVRNSELPKAQIGLWSRLDSLRWAPDGKHLSYILDNNLYTIPVD